jgi:hypothetical protein
VAPPSSSVYAEDMAGEEDPGVDKFDVLAEIHGVPPPAPPPLPDAELVPPEPVTAPPASGPPPPSSGAFRLPSPPWVKHRHEIAALVSAFVAVVWLSIGIARREWTPSLIGAGFGLGALLIGAFEVWTEG